MTHLAAQAAALRIPVSLETLYETDDEDFLTFVDVVVDMVIEANRREEAKHG